MVPTTYESTGYRVRLVQLVVSTMVCLVGRQRTASWLVSSSLVTVQFDPSIPPVKQRHHKSITAALERTGCKSWLKPVQKGKEFLEGILHQKPKKSEFSIICTKNRKTLGQIPWQNIISKNLKQILKSTASVGSVPASTDHRLFIPSHTRRPRSIQSPVSIFLILKLLVYYIQVLFSWQEQPSIRRRK